jgi:xylan 1,4-beta-xylosidase
MFHTCSLSETWFLCTAWRVSSAGSFCPPAFHSAKLSIKLMFGKHGKESFTILCGRHFAFIMLFAFQVFGQTAPVRITVEVNKDLGPMEIDRFSLGQGGLADVPIWEDRIPEIRSLHPRLIRLFLQEYFDLYPRKGVYHWEKLDASVQTITDTGASPLMCIAIKPKLLFPTLDQDIVEPNSYPEWSELIFQMVKHYREKGSNIKYWEIANEPDIGEDGGCPSRFTADNYPPFYEQTAKAILRADPAAKVGGPALANPKSPILPALLTYCSSHAVPLHFVSWHIYNSDPAKIRATIGSVKTLLAGFPNLSSETILNEWNMSLRDPVFDSRFQPCFIAEVAYQMFAAGLSYSCYYHIRDFHVRAEQFGAFMSPRGTLLMARWWNHTPQFDGLFDFQNFLRPSFFAFRLLSRLIGQRLAVELPSETSGPHAIATIEPSGDRVNVLLWNFGLAAPPASEVMLQFKGLQGSWRWTRTTLDATASGNDENQRLVRTKSSSLPEDAAEIRLAFEPYQVSLITLEKK